jgi:hypothetical protein
MENYADNIYLFDEIFLELERFPNKHLIEKRLKDYSNIPEFEGFAIKDNRNGKNQHFITINNKELKKFNLTCTLGFYDSNGLGLEYCLHDFSIDLFVVLRDPDYYQDHLIMGIDELIMYLTTQRNDEAKKLYEFPVLKSCQYHEDGFNYISEGRRILNNYFPELKGPSMDLYFEYELNEVFAITSNSLVLLFRNKDRVFEEIDLIKTSNYYPQLEIWPRFANCISETAAGIYNFWERVTFVFNEFFPLDTNSKQTPSFYQYFTKHEKKVDLPKSENFYWFFNRLGNEHKKLGEMRHPVTHFNKYASQSGMRSIELIKQLHTDFNKEVLKQQWLFDLEFLKSELSIISTALEKMLLLVEEWAISQRNC